MGVFPKEAFGSTPFPTDWLDTVESQRLLRYQRHTLNDYVQDMTARLGFRRHLIRMFRPLVRYLLLRQSPYYHAGRPGWFSAALHGFKALKGKPIKVNGG